jgi:hypothetical protein
VTAKESEGFMPYERELHHLQKQRGAEARHWIGPVGDVLDIAKIVKLWFDDYAPNATAADIIAMTKLIIDREGRHRAAIARATEELDAEF